FNEALLNANSIISKEDATQEEISESYNKLIRSYLNLRLMADKSMLQDLINKSETIDTSKYTKESINILNLSLANAKAILMNDEATQEEVDKATLEISSAIDNLVEINNDKIDDDDKTDGKAGNNKNNSGKGNTDNLPNTGAVIGGLSSMVAIALTTIGAVLFKKKED
ncbi:MAG: LPXTG cell wall anchor domain-containing protein, partial [Clostridium sp.]